jgi:hypothetical protein
LPGFAAGVGFLITSGIQTGADPGAFVAERTAVVRGRVLDAAGDPLPLVRITLMDHPAFGQTLTRTDGRFDLMVNGGGLATVRFEKDGLLPAQRQVDVPWSDFVTVPDVVMLGPSPITTMVQPGAAEAQEALGDVVNDGDGTRRALVIVQPGTTAEMEMPDGSMQPLAAFHVRITEFTVGDVGPSAMPGDLPPTSGYTYAAEFGVDEAVAAGAVLVRFSEPVIHYVENFLHFPVGTAVPTGSYDRTSGQWIPSANGRVVKIVGVTADLADLDLDGDDLADDPAALGIVAGERERLAARYAVGTELWRTPLPHFTPWDHNWPYGPDPGDRPPNRPKPGGDDLNDKGDDGGDDDPAFLYNIHI